MDIQKAADGARALPLAAFCVAVKTVTDDTRTPGSVIWSHAEKALRSRGCPPPAVWTIGKRNFVHEDDVPVVLRGLVPNAKKLSTFVDGYATELASVCRVTEKLQTQLHQELNAEASRLGALDTVLGLFEHVTIRTSPCSFNPKVVLIEILPVLRGIGYTAQQASDTFRNSLLPDLRKLYVGYEESHVQCTDISPSFNGISKDGRPVIVEYIKAQGARIATPYLSAAALEFCLLKAGPKTPQGEAILREAVRSLGRICAGDLNLAEEIVQRKPVFEDVFLDPEEAERQRRKREPLVVLNAPEELKNPESSKHGDLYGMLVYEADKFVGAKIGRSEDPLTRAAQLDDGILRFRQKNWTHVPRVIVRQSGCLESLVHKHFQTQLMDGHKEYFDIPEDSLREKLDEALLQVVPLWNEKQFQLERKARDRLGEDDDLERQVKRRRTELELKRLEEEFAADSRKLEHETAAHSRRLDDETAAHADKLRLGNQRLEAENGAHSDKLRLENERLRLENAALAERLALENETLRLQNEKLALENRKLTQGAPKQLKEVSLPETVVHENETLRLQNEKLALENRKLSLQQSPREGSYGPKLESARWLISVTAKTNRGFLEGWVARSSCGRYSITEDGTTSYTITWATGDNRDYGRQKHYVSSYVLNKQSGIYSDFDIKLDRLL